MLRDNLEAMGLRAGYIGVNVSGFVVEDFDPLLYEGRAYHDSVALNPKAPPPVEAPPMPQNRSTKPYRKGGVSSRAPDALGGGDDAPRKLVMSGCAMWPWR